MNDKAFAPNLTCFLLGHDLHLYRLTYRNQSRLVCRRCRRNPYAGIRLDVWQRLLQRAKALQGEFDEVPF